MKDNRRAHDNERESLSSHPSPSEVFPVTSGSRKRRKRQHSPEDSTTDSGRQPKHLKADNDDLLRSHLPEVSESHTASWDAISNISELRASVLEVAKVSNTIAYLPRLSNIDTICYEFLDWSIQEAKREPSPLRKVSIFLVENEGSLDAHGLYIRNSFPDISSVVYTSNKDANGDLLKYDVIITTPQSTLDLCLKGLVRMHQVQALIIEDAQHIKSNDCYTFLPIVQLMDTFYSSYPSTSRPRVFAVALCSDLSQHPFNSRSLKLETTLHAQTYGVTRERRNAILDLPDRPREVVVLYDQTSGDSASPSALHSDLQVLDPEMSGLRKYFHEAKYVAQQIGTCASDLVFRRALKDLQSNLPSWSMDVDDDANKSSSERNKVLLLETIKNWTFTLPNTNSSSRGFNVTYKFLRLIQVLEACSGYGEDFRGIIFVQQHATAFALVEMIKMLPDQLKFLSPFTVSGQMPFQTQQQGFSNFASGSYNLLVITKSAIELGVPKASVVIRFDLLDDQLLYGQIRACARGRESHLIHLVERHNDHHRNILENSTSCGEELYQWMDTLRDSETILVPPTSLKDSASSDSSDDDESGLLAYIQEPTLGGRVYPQDAVLTLLKYTSSLCEEGLLTPGHSIFNFTAISRNSVRDVQFVCTISIPNTEIDGVSGPSEPSKQIARRSTAFAACKQLLMLGLLDYRIVPLRSAGVDSSNSSDVPKEGGAKLYPLKSPSFWGNGNTGPVSVLYPTVVCVEGPNGPYGPLLLLTRQPFPAMSSFDLFVSGKRTNVRTHRGRPFALEEEKSNVIHSFTIRLIKACLNKAALCPIPEMTYFFGALKKSWRPSEPSDVGLPEVANNIDWELMSLASGTWALPINISTGSEIDEELADAVIQDRWSEFTRRYYALEVRHDLTPLSKPEDSQRESGYESLLAYVAERRKPDFPGLKTLDQPILEVEKISPLLNNVNPRMKDPDPTEGAAKYLIPELCAKFAIPASLMRTLMLMPSVLLKIDDLFVVKELNMRLLNGNIQEELLYMAITTVSAEMEYNYERLELLGDAFLKYLSSVAVFVMNPTQNEGSLHIARQALISNKVLLACAIRVNLPQYIRSKPFNLKAWRPWPSVVYKIPKKETEESEVNVSIPDKEHSTATLPEIAQNENDEAELNVPIPDKEELTSPATLPGTDISSAVPPAVLSDGAGNDEPGPQDGQKKSRKRRKSKKQKNTSLEGDWQTLGDKAIADVVEAILGAAYVSGGRDNALSVAKALSLPIPGINSWSDFGSKVAIPYTADATKLRPGSIEAVETIIGHPFRQPHLLAQVLTHTSAQGKKALMYERLEFIGDAILDFMVIRHIYDREHTLSPGGLTMLKSAMVANSTLAAICVLTGIHEHLLFGSYHLSNSIQEYAKVITEKAREEYALAEREGRAPGQFWASVEPPKSLSDVVESIIGALYISDGLSPVGAEAFFDNALRPFFNRHIALETLAHHPAKTLFEFIQAHGCQQLKLIKGSKQKNGLATCDILIHETEFASASETSLAAAARRASTVALARFQEEGNVLLSLCDCRTGGQGKLNAAFKKGFEHALSSLQQELEGAEGDAPEASGSQM